MEARGESEEEEGAWGEREAGETRSDRGAGATGDRESGVEAASGERTSS